MALCTLFIAQRAIPGRFIAGTEGFRAVQIVLEARIEATQSDRLGGNKLIGIRCFFKITFRFAQLALFEQIFA
ncbi:Uncharacterised protein [Vibrio cholerae]|nr:Uncharacterised protein [Vibrio cholerae]CRZ84555.1 Uncharacterised protein [Vibrio cholerae]CSA07777.1 Uncharacterised protein [Vibrio cholerae]CSA32107.1 Uncharacterised protein [Vibrio cholerae]CSA78113.1 Uncharacterised protein [Vibrio cholerae]